MKADTKQKTKPGTEIEKPRTRELSDAGGENYFQQYGQQVAQRNIVGDLLKFNKGDWLHGEEDNEMDVGTKLVANMDQLMVGWIKWVDNKPVEQIMGSVAQGYQPPRRNTLGDDDEDAWDVDNDGKPRDPWQFSNYLIMKRPGKDGEMFTFATSSKGGLGCVGELCKHYGKEMRVHPDEYPIIEIGTSAYIHSKKEFGRIKIPTMKPVGWEKKTAFAVPDAAADEEDPPKPVAKNRTRSKR